MYTNRIVGYLSLTGFLASIPFANWWLDTRGMWDAPLLGLLPSALWVVAISFILRDVTQITLGRTYAWAAIAAGTFLSVILANPLLAVASGVAFFVSESTDAAIFTPLANRGRFLLAVTISGYVAGFVDSALFVRIAFGSWSGWWQVGVAKALVIAAAAPIVWLARRALLREPV
jgi:uncharacterized PurR-regulated membrane protein YhhQ (DUF165 family)